MRMPKGLLHRLLPPYGGRAAPPGRTPGAGTTRPAGGGDRLAECTGSAGGTGHEGPANARPEEDTGPPGRPAAGTAHPAEPRPPDGSRHRHDDERPAGGPGRARPRRSVRLRFTALYSGVFLASAIALLAIVGIFASGSKVTHVVPVTSHPDGQVPDALAHAQAQIGRLQAALSDAHAAQSRALLVGSLIALGVMTVASIVLGRAIAGRVLRPLRTMTAATRRISAENLHERLAVAGPADEVKGLADTIDDLLERLEGAFAAQRRFVADASHELRTPLTTMRASLDVALAKPAPAPAQTVALAGRLRGELDRMDRLLDGLLVLARTQHGAFADRATVSLGRLASAALADRAADIDAKRLSVRDETGDGAWVRGSETLLRRVVDNIIDNAIVHNDDGGRIRVAASPDGEWARLVVETGGPLLDQRQVDGLAEPFRRLGTERTGSDRGAGLGLSIVAAVAAAHGGSLDLRARPEGGLRVCVALPAAPRPAVAEAPA